MIILPTIQNGLNLYPRSKSQKSNIYVDTAPVTTEEKPKSIGDNVDITGKPEEETLSNMYAAVDKSRKKKDANESITADAADQEDETIMFENADLYSDRRIGEPVIDGVAAVQDDKSLAGFQPNFVTVPNNYDNVKLDVDSAEAYSEIMFEDK